MLKLTWISVALPLNRPPGPTRDAYARRGTPRRREIDVDVAQPGRRSGRSLATSATLALATAAFVAVGALGLYRYVDNYWLYRGFTPPKNPAYVKSAGTQQIISIKSNAIGGRSQQTYVFLPPGYAQSPTRRYPVIYLLHGFPGLPNAFMLTVRVGVLENELVARRLMRPAIIVMPYGSTGVFSDKEWANGIGRDAGWATFVARDVVHAIDMRYRTIRSGAARAIGGLSEGGYGALNIAFHHPGEFRVVESWSGYERADNVPAVFGGKRSLLAANSPALYLPKVAAALRRSHTYVWFYSARRDPELPQNRAFAAELARSRIAHRFFVVPGSHTWVVWRGNARRALLAAGARIAHG